MTFPLPWRERVRVRGKDLIITPTFRISPSCFKFQPSNFSLKFPLEESMEEETELPGRWP
jgi:hypothetical protein